METEVNQMENQELTQEMLDTVHKLAHQIDDFAMQTLNPTVTKGYVLALLMSVLFRMINPSADNSKPMECGYTH